MGFFFCCGVLVFFFLEPDFLFLSGSFLGKVIVMLNSMLSCQAVGLFRLLLKVLLGIGCLLL